MAAETQQVDEAVLIKQAMGGDLNSFNRIVMIYQSQAYNLAVRMLNDEALAEDATQISFISAYQAIRSYRGGSFRAWMLRIVTNTCYDELRRQKRKPTQPLEPVAEIEENLDAEPSWLVDPNDPPEDLVIRKELEERIQGCIEGLPEEFRAVVILVDVQGMDYQEASQTVRSPVGTIRSRLARARQRLQDCLQDSWELLPEKFRLYDEGRP
jgi:RNA polymerase sigma-70 factor (ECF subfamily)